MARLLVAGATGRIGRLLGTVWQMAPPADVTVTFTGRRAEWPVKPQHVACRRADPEAFQMLLSNADIVLDLAGPTRAPDTDTHRDCLDIFRSLAALTDKPVLTMSTSAVYGQGAMRREDEVAQPHSPYGAARLELETLVKSRPRATALRLGNVAGADALLGRMVPGQPVLLDQFDDGATPRRSYLGPESLADLLVALCRHALSDGLPHVLNLCGQGTVEMAELLEATGQPWVSRPAPASAIRDLTLSAALLKTLVEVPKVTAHSLVAEWQRHRA